MDNDENLKFYEEKIKSFFFFSEKPISTHITRFYINKMLYKLYDHGPLKPFELIDTVYAEKRVHNKPEWLIKEAYFNIANFFGLAKKENDKILLTEVGRNYVESDTSREKDLTLPQAEFIREWLLNHPFENKFILGIYIFLDTILETSLIKDEQLPDDKLLDFFAIKSRKLMEWNNKTKNRVFGLYKGFSKEIGLIEIYYKDIIKLTPEGFKLLVKMQGERIEQIYEVI